MKKFIYIAVTLVMAGCVSIPPPVVKPFADNHDWMLVEDLTYSIGRSGVSITIPKGFVTDFASIPQPLWSFGLSPYGRYSKAAIVHDYLYWVQDCTKDQADNILVIAMKESGVSSIQEIEIYEGVHLGGDFAWQSNKKEREQQFPRVISAEYRQFPDNATWSEYRKYLVSKEVRDPSFPRNAPYCKFGDSRRVP
jgi:hypothetical protein